MILCSDALTAWMPLWKNCWIELTRGLAFYAVVFFIGVVTDNSFPLRVAVTGAAGQIGYSLLFRIASGQMFGARQPVRLHLIEIEPAMRALEGVLMELEDCAFPLLKSVEATSNLDAGFDGVNWAILVGSVPRKAGMERKDLLGINGKIFVEQGQALQRNAADDFRTLVVGNPCNTNCLIAAANAPDVPKNRWFAMTRLDENRAKSQLARKASAEVEAVSRLAVWGNHSATQYPDFANARIGGQPAAAIINDGAWLQGEFIRTVQQRGAAIIRARGSSSAASAANAIVDTVHSLLQPTPNGDWHSLCLASNGEYGVPQGLVCSFPVRVQNAGELPRIVENLPLNAFSREKIDLSVNELKEEKAAVLEHLSKT